MERKECLNVEIPQTVGDISHNIRQNRRMIAICVCLGLFWRCSTGMHYVLHVKCSEMSVQTSKYLKRVWNNAQFSTKSTQDCDLRVSGLDSTMENACTTFCVHVGVRRVFKRRNTWNGREITLNFRQNRGMIAICVCLGLLRRWRTGALRSARIMQGKDRLNVEISRTGEKYRIMFDKIDHWLWFTFIWAWFDDGKRVHYVLRAYWSEACVQTSKYLERERNIA